ncbi:MAG: Asp-tRNA(Asn)/Glu-tRNA(Gln) amidotransferase subunit GatC [Candidatus Paceibacterota bacterium]
MISKEEVQHIAKLARLGLTEKEVEKFQKELSPVLDYIEKLKKADISGVEPMSHSVRVDNITRGDKESDSKFNSEKLLDLSPSKKERHLKVKSIL